MADEHGDNECSTARCDLPGLLCAPPNGCRGSGIMLMAVQAVAMRGVVMSLMVMPS